MSDSFPMTYVKDGAADRVAHRASQAVAFEFEGFKRKVEPVVEAEKPEPVFKAETVPDNLINPPTPKALARPKKDQK